MVKSLIAEKLGISYQEVTPNGLFVEDLGADSLDCVELISAFEERFQLEIPDDEAEEIKTPQQAIDYVQRHVAN